MSHILTDVVIGNPNATLQTLHFPASVESILSWAARLQDRVNYVVVENAMTHQADFSY